MIRQIIKIDQQKCNGCGLCAKACHEGAIAIINHKATLIKDSYCDGMGDCLPHCPMDAIAFINKEAEAYDALAVEAHLQQRSNPWPIQLKLVNPEDESFLGSSVLLCADCTGYAKPSLLENRDHKRLVIACPKLDNVDYALKLSEIFRINHISKVELMLMSVPCCKGLERMVQKAIEISRQDIELNVQIIPTRVA